MHHFGPQILILRIEQLPADASMLLETRKFYQKNARDLQSIYGVPLDEQFQLAN